MVSLLLLLWGAAWASAYYIPPSIVAMRIGGTQHAALVTNVFDMGGYIFGAFFTYQATKSGGHSDWANVMLALIFFNGIGLVTMALAMLPEDAWTGLTELLSKCKRPLGVRDAKLLNY